MKPIYIETKTLPEGWEAAVCLCWKFGDEFTTHYDKPHDPPSRDIMAIIHIKEPFKEPRIHRAMPDGLPGLEKYRNEVVLGAHDYWVGRGEDYTYHERIKDQTEQVISMLRKDPFTRRAKLEVWRPSDLSLRHAPCAQYFWFRGEKNFLHMTMHIRSNDAYKAGFMNMFAFTELQAYIAQAVGLLPGTYTHIADSFHIYGCDFERFERGFLKLLQMRGSLEDRSFTTKYSIPHFIEGCDELLNEPNMPNEMKFKIRARKNELINMLPANQEEQS